MSSDRESERNAANQGGGDAGSFGDFAPLVSALAERYTFEDEIGRGGAGVVFRATDKRERRLVAIKVLRPDVSSAMGAVRFQREIEIARHLSHPNILPLFDFGTLDGLTYFTMPLVAGETLRRRLERSGPLPLTEAIDVARAVASALDHAHAKGVVHRDVKPGNILIGESATVVADFGIARALVPDGSPRITDSGIVVGTPEYMSPEQATGERSIDARSDVYALACVLYEMLAGEPPFTGPNAQAIIARHCRDAPPPLRTVRPSVPVGVERAIERALAKVPADRFANASAFLSAVDAGLAGGDAEPKRQGSRRTAAVVGVAAIAVGAIGLWSWVQATRPAINANHVVVFPLYDPGAPPDDNTGEAVADYVGHALAGTRPLRWVDGWQLMGRDARDSRERLQADDARTASRRAGAAFFIDGSIIRQPDSVTVLLQLTSVGGDSVVSRGLRTVPAGAFLPRTGVELVAELLPALIAPGGRVDLSALTDRAPEAVANFLHGERESRRMEFADALPHYHAALAVDSAFAHAALRGAMAANWRSDTAAASALSRVALQRVAAFAPPEALFARGLSALVEGHADSAVHYLTLSAQADPGSPATWTALGQTFLYTLPSGGANDSLARAALERARTVDAGFSPALLLLEEIAVRAADSRLASRLRRELAAAGADTTHEVSRSLMLRCVEAGNSRAAWNAAVPRNELAVLTAAAVLGGNAAQPACALGAYWALLEDDSVRARVGHVAALGLFAQLSAMARWNEAREALDALGPGAIRPPLNLFVAAASNGELLRSDADAIADRSASSAYARRDGVALWHLALWEYATGDSARVEVIADAARRRADSTGSRVDRLMSQAIEPRRALVRRDTARAVLMLVSLEVSARGGSVTWQPWESLGAERVLLAQLHEAQGRPADAFAVATLLDAPGPAAYPYFLRSSLEIRRRAAIALGRPAVAAAMDRRLSELDGVPADGPPFR